MAAVTDGFALSLGRGEAEVGLDQHVLQIVERGRVELALGEYVADAAPDRRGRARQARGEPAPPGDLGLRARPLVSRRRFGAAEYAAQQPRPSLAILVGCGHRFPVLRRRAARLAFGS